ncbi:MAG: RNA methyltransferase [Gemmatimonadales bacterium]|jgi:TrmH family RNA methyltransferase
MASNLITQIRNLQRRKARKRSGLAVAEGVRLVEEALDAGVAIRGAVVTPTAGDQPRAAALLQRLAEHAVAIEEVGQRAFERLADTDTPQGVLVVVEVPRAGLGQIAPAPGQPVVVLDGVQDPGNVGTLIRTAFALGAAGAVLLTGTADPANPKVVRSAMGATFRLPLAAAQDGEFRKWVEQHDVTLWVAAGDGVPVERLTVPERVALVVGNEGAGARPLMRSLAAQQVAVPLARGAESLNVSVAAGIILNEVRRVR